MLNIIHNACKKDRNKTYVLVLHFFIIMKYFYRPADQTFRAWMASETS